MKTLREIVENNFGPMVELFKGQNTTGTHDPLLLAFREGATALLVVPLGRDNKDAVAAAMAKWLQLQEAHTYCFVCEGWMKVLPVGSDIPDSIADDPERKEVVVVTAGNADEDLLVTYDIIRNEGGKITDLIKQSEERPEYGRFVGLLRKETTRH